ncbi:MAG TPA: hypothetical protein VIA18_17445 [Polyangia bacterium]|jgi:hypothetical protein|nr:hypothetical protein [Polyangia bacterium]
MNRVDDKRSLGIGQALSAAAQWRLLLVWTLGLLVPTVVAALPIWRLLAVRFDPSPRAADIARHFDMLAFEDVIPAFGRSAAPIMGGILAAALVFALVQPLLAGVTLAAARQPFEPLRTRTLLERGMAFYGRMFRLMLVSFVVLGGFIGAIGGGVGAITGKIAKHAVLESTADRMGHLANAITLIVFILVHATIEAARAHLAADDQRRSAWRAWWAGVRLLAHRPGQVLGLYLGPTVVSLVVAFVLLAIRIRLVGSNAILFLLAFIVTQLAVAAIGWGRAARLFALTDLMRGPVAVAPAAPTIPAHSPVPTPDSPVA